MPDQIGQPEGFGLARLVAAVPGRLRRLLTPPQEPGDSIFEAAQDDSELAAYLESDRIDVVRLLEAGNLERWN